MPIYRPNKIRIKDKTTLGILSCKPNKEAKDVKSIGPKNHAKGILKKSAANAPGKDIKITQINFFEKTSLNSIELANKPLGVDFHHDKRKKRKKTPKKWGFLMLQIYHYSHFT